MKSLFPHSSETIGQEISTMKRHFGEISKHVGKFVLIQGDTVVNYFASYGDAIRMGYKKFGLNSFLVRQIKVNEVPIRVVRLGISKKQSKLRSKRDR